MSKREWFAAVYATWSRINRRRSPISSSDMPRHIRNDKPPKSLAAGERLRADLISAFRRLCHIHWVSFVTVRTERNEEGLLMDQREWLVEQFEAKRSHLRAIAYRMLGSLSEADDAVQKVVTDQ
jgi:hypothetical protein